MANPHTPDWNSFGRANASQKWRRQSAEMGSTMTQTIVEAAQVEPGMHVLDVACGSGEPAISIATLLAGTGEVTGVDVSPAPLQIANQRARQRSLTNVRFQEADAHHLPFPEASFERVTSRLGIMFFADPVNAMREMHRVLKPGGRAALLTWGVMGQPYFSSTIGTLLRVAQTGTIPEAARKMFAYGQPGLLARHLRSAGFEHAEEKFVTVEWIWPGTPQEVWDYFQEVTVPFAPLLKSVPQEKRAEVDAAVVQAIGEYYDGSKVNFTAKINLTIATK